MHVIKSAISRIIMTVKLNMMQEQLQVVRLTSGIEDQHVILRITDAAILWEAWLAFKQVEGNNSMGNQSITLAAISLARATLSRVGRFGTTSGGRYVGW